MRLNTHTWADVAAWTLNLRRNAPAARMHAAQLCLTQPPHYSRRFKLGHSWHDYYDTVRRGRTWSCRRWDHSTACEACAGQGPADDLAGSLHSTLSLLLRHLQPNALLKAKIHEVQPNSSNRAGQHVPLYKLSLRSEEGQ